MSHCVRCLECPSRDGCVTAERIARTRLPAVSVSRTLATLVLLFGAVLVSFSTSMAAAGWVFALFLVGHVTWSLTSWYARDYPSLWINAGLLPFDLWAIVVRLGWGGGF